MIVFFDLVYILGYLIGMKNCELIHRGSKFWYLPYLPPILFNIFYLLLGGN